MTELTDSEIVGLRKMLQGHTVYGPGDDDYGRRQRLADNASLRAEIAALRLELAKRQPPVHQDTPEEFDLLGKVEELKHENAAIRSQIPKKRLKVEIVQIEGNRRNYYRIQHIGLCHGWLTHELGTPGECLDIARQYGWEVVE